jgi:hypothetical protein
MNCTASAKSASRLPKILFALNHRITRTQVSLRIPGDTAVYDAAAAAQRIARPIAAIDARCGLEATVTKRQIPVCMARSPIPAGFSIVML